MFFVCYDSHHVRLSNHDCWLGNWPGYKYDSKISGEAGLKKKKEFLKGCIHHVFLHTLSSD